MAKKLLLISYSFPPMAAPESYLSAKTLGGLDDYETHVICGEPLARLFRTDHSLDAYVSQRFARIYPIPFQWWIREGVKTNLGLKAFLTVSQFPDRCIYLGDAAVRVAESLDLSGFAAMVSWSQFQSSHLAAFDLKQRHPQIPWLAHFSDPWVDNPFNRMQIISNPLNGAMERKVIERADYLIFTSALTVDLVMQKYGPALSRKAVVIPHPFEPALLPDPPVRNAQGLQIFRYLGNFYGARNPRPLLKAIDDLYGVNPKLFEGIRFEFVGPSDSWFDVCDYPRIPPDLVRFFPPVDYVKSLELMTEAAVQMVIDAPAKQSVFLPSKLVDYLGAGRPVLGVTPPGTSADLIREIGGVVADPSSSSEIRAALERVLDPRWVSEWSSQKDGGLFAQVRDRYSVQKVANQMRALIESA